MCVCKQYDKPTYPTHGMEINYTKQSLDMLQDELNAQNVGVEV